VPGWELPDPLTVDVDSVGRRETLATMHALGFALLTNSPRTVADARSVGVDCTYVGTARPVPNVVGSENKEVDVAALMDNRWAPLAGRVLAELDGTCTIDRIGSVPNDELLSRLAKARVLAFPSRIEGHASIPWEARCVGCVPVALSTNRFAVGLSDDRGAVVVDTVADISPAIRDLLANPERLRGLAARGRRTAPHEADWDEFVERVRGFVASVPERTPDRDAYAGMGAALLEWQRATAADAQARLQEKHSEVHVAAQQLADAARRHEDLLHELGRLRAGYRRRVLRRARRAAVQLRRKRPA